MAEMEGGSDMEESFRWRELHGLTVISPYIDVSNSPNVTVALGKTALLTCRVKALSDRTVSFFPFPFRRNAPHSVRSSDTICSDISSLTVPSFSHEQLSHS